MARASIPRRRLAAAVTVALAVTMGGLTAPAVAAGHVAAGHLVTGTTNTQQNAVATLLPQSFVIGNGPTGFLTRHYDNATVGTVYRWTRYADGVTTTLPTGTYNGSVGSDVIVKSEGAVHKLYDMATGADPVVIDTGSLGTGTKFVRLAGSTVVVANTRADGGTDVYLAGELNGMIQIRKVQGLPTDAVIRQYDLSSPDILTVVYYGTVNDVAATHAALVDVADSTVVEHRALPGASTHSDVSVSATHVAWAESDANSTARLALTRRDSTDVTRVPLGSGAPLRVELMGDWVTYGVTGGLSAGAPNPLHALTARSLTDGRTVKLLDVVDGIRSDVDGELLVQGGTIEHGEGLYRIAPGPDGTPAATLVASTGRPITLQVKGQTVPETFDFRTTHGDDYLMWQFAGSAKANVKVELTHKASGKRWSLLSYIDGAERAYANWNGLLDDHTAATNGEYTWKMTAQPKSGIGSPVELTGTVKVDSGQAPHDFSDSGSPDLVLRQGGTLFLVDGRQSLYFGAQTTPEMTDIGAGWDAYNQIVTPGNVGGARYSDVVAGDKSGTLWLHVGNGKSGFSKRTRIGGGWQIYNQLTGGSDLDRDGRPDLVATDKAGDLWLYKGTGNATAPFAPRKKIGYGWGVYDKIVATGNIGGNTTGDLVARDKAGVLWLYLGNGDGTFAKRRLIGGGWDRYSEIVGIGDADRDGRADLVVNGRTGGTDDNLALYRGTGDWKVPFAGRVGIYTHDELSRYGTTLF